MVLNCPSIRIITSLSSYCQCLHVPRFVPESSAVGLLSRSWYQRPKHNCSPHILRNSLNLTKLMLVRYIILTFVSFCI